MSNLANAKTESERFNRSAQPLGASEQLASAPMPQVRRPTDEEQRPCSFERRMFADGIMRMPDGNDITYWGFEDPSAPYAPKVFQSPMVRVNQGDRLNMKLDLQAPVPATSALAAPGGRAAGAVSVNKTESCLYSWNAQKPGVWFYQSHTGTPHDFEMGLYGVLVIDPPRATDGRPTLFEGGPTYDQEHFLVLDDVDPEWHRDAEKRLTPDAGQQRRAFNPKYFLVNGVANTEAPYHPRVSTRVERGNKLLLRLCNASFSLLRVSLGNLQANIVSVDGSPLGTRERPWTSCIPVRPNQPIFMSTASRLDVLIDFDPAMNDVASGGSCPVDIEYLDLSTRQVRNINAKHSAHVGRTRSMIQVV